jgi:hypothetical protein
VGLGRAAGIVLIVWGWTPALLQPLADEPVLVGYAECFGARLPLAEFSQQHPEVAVARRPYARNAWGHPDDRPYSGDAKGLPDVFPVHVGRFAEDLPELAERGLIEPVEEWLRALGLAPEDFPPEVREAVSHRGRMWAIPHHVLSDALHLHRESAARLGLDANPQSWEALFSLLEQAEAAGVPATFSAAGTLTDLLECMLLSAGHPPLDLSALDAWESPAMVSALALLQSPHSTRRLQFRAQNVPLRLAGPALAGTGRVESLHASAAYRVIPYPSRLRELDPPATTPAVPAMLEAYAVRAHRPEARAGILAFLAWLLSDETEWAAFEATNLRNADQPVRLDTVHVPMRASVRASLDFEYAFRKFPDLSVLQANADAARFARGPAALEHRVMQMAEATMARELAGAGPEKWLPALRLSIELLVKNTPVETRAYHAY